MTSHPYLSNPSIRPITITVQFSKQPINTPSPPNELSLYFPQNKKNCSLDPRRNNRQRLPRLRPLIPRKHDGNKISKKITRTAATPRAMSTRSEEVERGKPRDTLKQHSRGLIIQPRRGPSVRYFTARQKSSGSRETRAARRLPGFYG